MGHGAPALNVNRVYLTSPRRASPIESLGEALNHWHSGEPLEIAYSGGRTCDGANDRLKLRMAGFTHAVIVWQRSDLSLDHTVIEL